jgi:PAS domain S-box-containing protein
LLLLMSKQTLTKRWFKLMLIASTGICFIMTVVLILGAYKNKVPLIESLSGLGLSLLILLLGLFLGGLIFYFFAKSISDSVIKIADAALEIGKGNLNSSINIESRDEIGVLANSFSKMARELKEHRDKQNLDKQFFDSIFKSMVDTLIVLKTDLTIERVNQAALRLLRYEEEELIGKPFGVVFAEKVFQDLEIQDLLNNGFITGAEKTYIAKDGKEIPMSFSCSVMKQDNGKILGIVCVATDLRERKWAEAERAQLIEEQAARAAAEANEKKHRALAEAIPQIVWTAGADGQIDYYNKRWFDYTGLSPKESEGLNWQSMLHPDDTQQAIEGWEQALSKGESFEIECRFKRADNTYRWHLSRALPVLEQEGKIIKWIGTCTDIDDQKRAAEVLQAAKDELERRVAERTEELSKANNILKEQISFREFIEEALQKEKEFLKALLENVLDGIIACDADGNISLFNRMTRQFHGLPNEPIPTELWHEYYDLYHPDGETKLLKEETPLFRALRGELVRNLEFMIMPKKGDPPRIVLASGQAIVNHQGKKLGAVVALHDVTERKRSEQALKESEERFQIAARATNDVIWDWNLIDNTMWWHESFKSAYGYSESECGHDSIWWFEYMHPEDKERVSSEIYMAINSGREFWSSEYRFRRSDGSYAHVLDRGFIIYDEGGRPLRVIGAMMDITERKQVEQSLIMKTAELERSNTELEQFAYVASHDLQEPLRMVASYTQLLARRYKGKLDANADEFISFAVDGATRMQLLINDLLEYSRVGRKNKEFAVIDCEIVFDQTISNLRAAIMETSAIITHDSLPTVMADDVQLCRLFQNLIGNAIKYHRQQEDPPRVHVSAKLEGNEWVFSVKDNGIGIDPKHFERIFVIFQRLHRKEEYSGTGIGLAICKKIIERHKGRIWVESQVGKGATFYFSLPSLDLSHRVLSEELTSYANCNTR